MAAQKNLIKRFLRYVKIPSLSKNERIFGDFIKNELRALSERVVEDYSGKNIGGNCGNIYAYIKGNIPDAPTIMFNAHLDTVLTGKIKPVVRGDKIISNGSSILGADDKAGVAVIMEVISRIKKMKLSHGNIEVVFTVAEEIGLLGAKHINKKFLKSDFGFAVDGGKVNLVMNAAPSQNSITAIIHGKAAHAGIHPENGIHAIKVISNAISKIKMGRIDHETTSNIGVIHGGVATNIIPDHVEIKGETRSHNENKLKNQTDHIVSTIKRECKKFGAKSDIKVVRMYDSFAVKESSFASKILKSAAIMSRIKLDFKPTGGGSDANIFNQLGIPTLIVGVGGRGAHTKYESVSISSMGKAADYFINIIKTAANEKRNIN